MAPPLKPFDDLCTKQKKRRVDKAVLDDCTVPEIEPTVNPSQDLNFLTCFSELPSSYQSSCPHLSASFPMLQGLNDMNLDARFNVQPDPSNVTGNITAGQLPLATKPNAVFHLRTFLAFWCIKNKIAHCVMSELLVALQKSGHPDLPADA